MYHHHLKRHPLFTAAAWTVEQLEQRTLLSGGVFDVSKIPVYTATSGDINDTKAGPLGNAGAHLAGLYSEYKSYVKKGGFKQSFSSQSEPLLQYKGTSVAVTVRTRADMATTTALLRGVGAELIYRDKNYSTVDAWVPISQLTTLASNSNIANLNPAFEAITFTSGVADNQGDQGQNADSARSTFGVDGTGIKVGVISDSVNSFEGGLSDSVASKDLPKGVQVITDDTGTDEGRAMLEEIHDIAPGASLAFSAAGATQNSMAKSIIDLVRAGCNVIVDDIGFFDEPFFQGGVIDQAITDAVQNHGVTYLSAARNGGSAGFQTNAHWVADGSGRTLLDWDPSSDVDTRMRVTINGTFPLAFGWDDPYNGIVGAATVDLDIAFIDPTTGATIVKGVDDNLVTGKPNEVLTVPAGTYDIEVTVADKIDGAPLPTVIKLASSNGTPANLTDTEYKGIRSTTSGHNGGQDAISVGAVPFYLATPYNNTQTTTNDEFSSLGPVTYLFKQNGERRTSPLLLQKPDVSGIDAVNTSFFGNDIAGDKDKLPNFFGTSAAAPNVAAVVALMLELNPNASPADIKAALIASAKTNPVNGQPSGSYNQQSGFGLIDSLQALHEIQPDTVVADIARVVPDSIPTGLNEIKIQFTSAVIGFNINDLDLVRGKESATDLLPGSGVSLTTKNHQTWVLSGLAKLTSKRGTYYLRFKPNGVLDRKTQTHPALNGETSFFVTGKPTGLQAIPVSAGEIDLSWTDNAPNETGFIVYRALDEAFSKGVSTFRTKAGVTHYKDTTGLVANTQYFYKVKAIVDDGAPNPTSSIVSAFALAGNEIVVDNSSADGVSIQGSWTTNSDSASYGGDYLTTAPAKTNTTKSVTYTPDLDSAGNYYIYVRNIKSKNNATNTPVSILNNGDTKKTFTIDQTNSSGWLLLGQFKLNAGTGTSVRISNAGANGIVVADAIRFQRTGTATASLASTTTAASLFSAVSVGHKEEGLVL